MHARTQIVLLVTAAAAVAFDTANAQAVSRIWYGGGINSGPVYGTVGVQSDANTPGTRNAHCQVAGIDGASFWIVAGRNRTGNLSDVWRFNITTKLWTWMAGPNATELNGQYGTQNVASPSNYPGARRYHSCWMDRDGNIWMFGGTGRTATSGTAVSLNDMWMFNTATLWWTWIGGSNITSPVGVYGTMFVKSGGWPGARMQHYSAFDGAETTYMFGGSGFGASGGQNFLQDLWSFNLTDRTWIWLNGSQTATLRNGLYGTRLTPSVYNLPGSRVSGANNMVWYQGCLYLFGGLGLPISGSAKPLGDMWRYDPVSREWTWMSGYNTGLNTEFGVYGPPGVMGSDGVPGTVTTPGARQRHTIVLDHIGNIWAIGGTGYGASGSSGLLNDVWKYSIALNAWAFMGGSNATGAGNTFGTLGESTGGTFSGRDQAAATIDASNNIWFFGGMTTPDHDGDLWFIQSDPDE